MADDRRSFREQMVTALRMARLGHVVAPADRLAVRVTVFRAEGRRGDVDNIAKPVLDALGSVIGVDASGRVSDERVRRLEVAIVEADHRAERVEVEIWLLRRERDATLTPLPAPAGAG
jgi:Holliday junction resolvase RusA-like endonuclease